MPYQIPPACSPLLIATQTITASDQYAEWRQHPLLLNHHPIPDEVILRIRLLSASATNKVPAESPKMPNGSLKLAEIPTPSAHPLLPEPAKVVTTPATNTNQLLAHTKPSPILTALFVPTCRSDATNEAEGVISSHKHDAIRIDVGAMRPVECCRGADAVCPPRSARSSKGSHHGYTPSAHTPQIKSAQQQAMTTLGRPTCGRYLSDPIIPVVNDEQATRRITIPRYGSVKLGCSPNPIHHSSRAAARKR